MIRTRYSNETVGNRFGMSFATRGPILGALAPAVGSPWVGFWGCTGAGRVKWARFSIVPKSHEKSRLSSENRSRGPNGGKTKIPRNLETLSFILVGSTAPWLFWLRRINFTKIRHGWRKGCFWWVGNRFGIGSEGDSRLAGRFWGPWHRRLGRRGSVSGGAPLPGG